MSREISQGNIGTRIKLLRESLMLNQQAFALSLGISQGYLSEVEKGVKTPSDTLLIAVEYRYEINEGWLLTGEGEMLRGSVYKGSVEIAFPENRDIGEDFVLIPLVSGAISAGGGIVPDETIEVRIAFRREWLLRRGDPRNMSLIRVDGDSMEPTLRRDDLILVDHNNQAINPQGGIYAIAIDGGIMVKRIELNFTSKRVRVISDNDRYAVQEMDPAHIFINGKVIWFGREIDR